MISRAHGQITPASYGRSPRTRTAAGKSAMELVGLRCWYTEKRSTFSMGEKRLQRQKSAIIATFLAAFG